MTKCSRSSPHRGDGADLALSVLPDAFRVVSRIAPAAVIKRDQYRCDGCFEVLRKDHRARHAMKCEPVFTLDEIKAILQVEMVTAQVGAL